jgi:hypothetical protein
VWRSSSKQYNDICLSSFARKFGSCNALHVEILGMYIEMDLAEDKEMQNYVLIFKWKVIWRENRFPKVFFPTILTLFYITAVRSEMYDQDYFKWFYNYVRWSEPSGLQSTVKIQNSVKSHNSKSTLIWKC